MLPFATERLIVRNWREGDRALFHEINSDERVMEFFPFRRDRRQSDELMDRLAASIAADGFGFAALELRGTGRCIGFAGLSRAGLGPPFAPGMIEIGWRLARPFWGHGHATEAARAWLGIGFASMGLDEIVSFAVDGNARSTAVMERLGMRRDPSRDFDHPRVPASHRHLSRHVFYSMTRRQWRIREETGQSPE